MKTFSLFFGVGGGKPQFFAFTTETRPFHKGLIIKPPWVLQFVFLHNLNNEIFNLFSTNSSIVAPLFLQPPLPLSPIRHFRQAHHLRFADFRESHPRPSHQITQRINSTVKLCRETGFRTPSPSKPIFRKHRFKPCPCDKHSPKPQERPLFGSPVLQLG